MCLLVVFVSGPSYGRGLEKFWNHQLVTGCTVLDFNDTILAQLPGKFCAFFDDGSFVSASDTHLRFITKDNEVKWEIPGHFHHQLNLSIDKTKILALGSRIFPVKSNGSFRSDRLMVVDLAGKILHEADSEEVLKTTGIRWLAWEMTQAFREITGAGIEMSHFNSFYEIPKNPNPAFKAGGYIVNGHSQGSFIFSPDLQSVTLAPPLRIAFLNNSHDVQVTERGNLLLFVNKHRDGRHENPFSTVNEVDPRTQKSVFEFSATPKELFYSEYCGGVQELDGDHVLISDQLTGTFVYATKRKKILSAVRKTHKLNNTPGQAQQVKLFDLGKFLTSRGIKF